MTGDTSSSGTSSNPPTGENPTGTTGSFGPPSTDPTGGPGGPGGPGSLYGHYYQLQVSVNDPVLVNVDPAIPGSGMLEGSFVIYRDPSDVNLDWLNVDVIYRLSGPPQAFQDFEVIDPYPGTRQRRSGGLGIHHHSDVFGERLDRH